MPINSSGGNSKKKKVESETSEYDKAFFSTKNRSKHSSLLPEGQAISYRSPPYVNQQWLILGLLAILAVLVAFIPVCLVWFNVANAAADSAYKKGDLAAAEAAYKSAAQVPFFVNQVVSRDKIANLELLQGHYDEGARLLKAQIVAHQVRFEHYIWDEKHHSADDPGLPYNDISEAEVLRYSLGNYGQALAALGRVEEFGPYQRIVWEEVLPKCEKPRTRLQIEKNILQHTAGSLFNRGYKDVADQMEAERRQYDNLDATRKEAKYLELIYKMAPPKPYDKPIFSRDALEN